MTIKENDFLNILKLIAPGTEIREGLDNILKAKTGALIVIAENKEVMDIVDGGFNINVDYTPARMYELAKMDGAIILSSDLKKILFANAQLIPSQSISTTETGTRHRTAERVAKQTGNIVISISQRRGIITIYKDDNRYVLEDTSRVANKANQALQTVEKYKKVLDNRLNMLNEYEFNDIVTLQMVIETLQRAEMLMQVVDEVQKAIYELGTDGRLIEMQLEELTDGIEEEEYLIIKDYLVGKNIDKYDSMLVLSHFKGHPMGGYGGALKQLSIGIASSEGKAWIHSAGQSKDQYTIWDDLPEQDKFLEAMADAAFSVHKLFEGKIVYINVMKNLSVDCDCCAVAEDPCMKDIGILASLDPIALDKACIDLIYNSKDPGRSRGIPCAAVLRAGAHRRHEPGRGARHPAGKTQERDQE